MNMEEAHRLCAQVAGELSLAIVRRKASREMMRGWVVALRRVADAFEAKMGGGNAGRPTS